MFRNLYDSDVTTWSSTGRLFQVEYAGEAVKQGSATVAVKNQKYAVLVALKRSQAATLSSYQEKIFEVDAHVGVSVTGLIADARYLSRFLCGECMTHRYMDDKPMSMKKIADLLSDKYQSHTYRVDKRPFGVGLLVAGYDSHGAHVIQTQPSGDVWFFKATAIGSRSQSARTYLEKHYASFDACGLDELVLHALKALANTTGEDVKLTALNTSIAVVGEGRDFEILDEAAAREYLDRLVLRAEDRVDAVGAADGDAAEIPEDTTE
jgi:20S proteasome subunit alpha 6